MPSILCFNAGAPVAQLVRTSDRISEDPGFECWLDLNVFFSLWSDCDFASTIPFLTCDSVQILCTQWLWSQILPVVHTPLDPLWTSPASYTHNHLGRGLPISGEVMFQTYLQLLQTPPSPMPLSPLREAILTQQDTTARCTTGINCLSQETLSSLYKVDCINHSNQLPACDLITSILCMYCVCTVCRFAISNWANYCPV